MKNRLFFNEQIICQLLVEVFYGVAIDLVVYCADKDDFGRTQDGQDGKEAQGEYDDSDQRMYQPAQQEGGDHQEEDAQQLDNTKTESGAEAFAPFVFHHGGGSFQGRQRSQVFVGDDRDHKESSDAPYDTDQSGDDLADGSQSFLDEAKDHSYGCRKDGPREDGPDSLQAESQALADGRFFALEVQVCTMDEGCIKEYNDEVVDQVVKKKYAVTGDGTLVPQGIYIPAGGRKQDHDKGADDEHHGDAR